MDKKTKRVMLTGGGTAGHVWPLILIAEELKRLKPTKFLYIGSPSGVERELVKPFYAYKAIQVGKWRRYTSIRNAFDLIRIMVGIGQAMRIIRIFRPKIIIAKGGYVSLPLIIAGRILSIPIVIHESDVIMGATNRFTARFAQKIFTGFPTDLYPKQFRSKIIQTGNPVRPEFWYAKKDVSVLKRFKLNNHLPVCLVIGGTQGSVAINSAILGQLRGLLAKIQIIHITGMLDYRRCLKVKNELPPQLFDRYQPRGFVKTGLPQLFGAADIIVSRAGANTLAEIAAASRASIIIPLPTAAADHQSNNAKWYSQHRAIITKDERSFSSRQLAKEIIELSYDVQKRKTLAQMIHRLADKQSATRAALEVAKLL